ncbi:MAG TPA: hypothetical protein PKA65_05420 [Solirubrobacterales bacterium]|nr:hypothetical protein [Solirubrobacterales bacterium]
MGGVSGRCLGVEAGPLPDPEAVFLVDNREGELPEADRTFEQGMGADQDCDSAFGQPPAVSASSASSSRDSRTADASVDFNSTPMRKTRSVRVSLVCTNAFNSV